MATGVSIHVAKGGLVDDGLRRGVNRTLEEELAAGLRLAWLEREQKGQAAVRTSYSSLAMLVDWQGFQIGCLVVLSGCRKHSLGGDGDRVGRRKCGCGEENARRWRAMKVTHVTRS